MIILNFLYKFSIIFCHKLVINILLRQDLIKIALKGRKDEQHDLIKQKNN